MIHLLRKELTDSAFIFISNGILFQITALEYDKLLLYKFLFGLGIRKFPLDTDLKFEAVSLASLLLI